MTKLLPLKSIWRHGQKVRDFQFGKTNNGKCSNSRSVGTTGILSLIGPFHVERFAIALRLVVVSRSIEKTVIKIDPSHVLSQPWLPDRIERCMAIREAEQFDSIQIEARVQMTDWPDLFLVENGMHRSYTARRFGDESIEAEVRETWICDPTAFFLDGSQLMHGSVGTSEARGREIASDVATILECLGCDRRDDPKNFTFELVGKKPRSGR